MRMKESGNNAVIMKKLFTYSFLTVLILAGCQVKELETEKQEVLLAQGSKPFVAIIEDDSVGNETRTTLDNSGNVLWKQGDQVSIFAGNSVNLCYQVSDESEGKTTAALNKISGSGSGSVLDNNVALYPYASTATIAKSGSNYVISGIELPAVQNYADGSFGNRTFPMAAITNSTAEMNLSFKNVLGGIKLQLKGTATITSITVTGNNNEILYGDAEVTISTESAPSINLTNASAKTVTLDCGTGVTLDSGTATSFIIALPPITMTGGFTVTVTDTEGKEMEIKSTRSQTVTRSSLLKMPTIEYEGGYITTVLYSWLPEDIGKESITNIEFHVNDDTITDKQLSASVPVYYEINGTTVNIYTQAKLYDISTVTGYMFWQYSSLKKLVLSNTIVRHAGSFFRMFCDCVALESIEFGNWDTSDLESMELMFSRCEKLRSLDLSFMNTGHVNNMYGVFSGCKTLSSIDISSFNTSNVTNMGAMFAECQSLSSLDLRHFDTKAVTNMNNMFIACRTIQSLDLSGFNTQNVTDMSQMFWDCQALKTIDLSSFNTQNVENMNSMFYGCSGLETLPLSNFRTSNCQNMYFMFGWCTFLKELDISSFSSESLQNAELMFGSCQRLQKLNLGTFDLSQVYCQDIGQAIMRTSKSGAIRCLPETRAVIEPTMDSSLSGKVEWMSLSDDINAFGYQRDPNLYYSSDFSKHETVRQLYSATIGKGLDIVIMGDAYSDRMIESGRYDADMELAADAIFAKEPFASLKEYFNVYIVYLVSDNEVLGESTALDGVASGSGILGGYASATVPEKYRILATGNGDLTVSDAIVVLNGADHVSGYANMVAWDFDVNYYDCDYGRGYSSAVVARGNPSESEEFCITMAHEFGHSFAKLADEYSTMEMTVEEGTFSEITYDYERFGWNKNVDVTSDPTKIRWSQFLSDDRYEDDGVGIFEGGFNYTQGVWRPSMNSIMNTGTEFNAPSRAAIYNRVHKLAYGNDWQFDYEEFVRWDQKNIGLEKRTIKSNSKSHHPHLNHEPFIKVEKKKKQDGRTEINVIMN